MAAAAAASRAGHARSCRSPRLILRIDRVPATAYIATMALRDILILPDKRLRQVSPPEKKNDPRVRKFNKDIFETMYDAPGIRVTPTPVRTPQRRITKELGKKEEAKE